MWVFYQSIKDDIWRTMIGIKSLCYLISLKSIVHVLIYVTIRNQITQLPFCKFSQHEWLVCHVKYSMTVYIINNSFASLILLDITPKLSAVCKKKRKKKLNVLRAIVLIFTNLILCFVFTTFIVFSLINTTDTNLTLFSCQLLIISLLFFNDVLSFVP